MEYPIRYSDTIDKQDVYSGDGSGIQFIDNTTDASKIIFQDETTAMSNNMSMRENQFATTIFVNGTIPNIISPSTGYKYVLYIGGGLSIVSCLIALFTYASSRKFRVKRPHMITINLCISLIIFYIGIVMSVASMDVSNIYSINPSKSCIAAASLFQLGLLFAWTWATVHWAYLTYSVHKIAAPHISHFVIKITLPAYGFPIILTGSILVTNSAWDNAYISAQTCFFRLGQPLTAVINFLYLVTCFAIMASCIGYCIGRLTCRDDKNHVASTRLRIKGSVTRLAVITTGVIAISILEFIRSGVVEAYSDTWFEVFNGIVLGAAGIIVSVGLTLRSKEFRLYLVKHSQSTVSVRRIVNNFSRKGRKSSQKSRSRNPSSSSIKSSKGVMCDVVRPPKPVPRESLKGTVSISSAPNIQPSSVISQLNLKSQSNEAIVDQNENTDSYHDVGNVNANNIGPVPRETKKSSVEKRMKAISRIGSLRQRVMSASFRNSTHPQDSNDTPPPSPKPRMRQQLPRSMCRTQVIPENLVDRISLTSVDLARQSSF
uniref:adhesion G-protein coupled receptor G7-like isoform X1 n=2 Tax=Styela clava TaxID=7725 RepID=UPI001939F86F|nr:adhesion G-protein coupled receptor G7-like isoform X1 [Styela clava]